MMKRVEMLEAVVRSIFTQNLDDQANASRAKGCYLTQVLPLILAAAGADLAHCH